MDSNELTIEQIAATLAHEMKNPISLAMACIDLLELEDTEGKSRKNYAIIRRELSKVTDIVMDFIHFTKPMVSPQHTLYVDKLLLEVLEDFRELYKSRAEFEWKSEAQEFQALGDEGKLRRVFFNIYKNAVEAIEEGGRIKTAISQCGRFIKVCIEDNGIGFNEEVGKQITTPFFTTKISGSGLGLFICKNIIAEHSGFFEISGEYAKGCRVTIELPLNLTT